jgi:hypothetical protein
MYERLMAAEQLIAEARSRRGVGDEAILEALAVSESETSAAGEGEDLYLSTLARFVAELGGHLELRAVFPDETVNIDLREDDMERGSERG